MALASDIIELLLYILPAMAANGAPVVGSKFYGKGHPIDMGAKMPDGQRVLGDGKTVEGFVTGILAGLVVGFLETLVLGEPFIQASLVSSVGALLGDMAGSFIKRRLGKERGAPAPLLDQLDFYVGALAMLYLAGYSISMIAALALAIIIIVLHVSTNWAAYRLGLKNVPW
ncbi:MAG: CDP-2,3-bis-(O-geranylgeranyl)-sn-glycerol synthase [Desulfurococcales archaeon]|nr:CDP-2,3-bis-(O-geranylgeranyl)-sn-glycerol synthase [Desulfurococcales archaeon]MCE4605613.1 CDP-2,3-bis-(O-geranylgeranyl)-sn-glycerol synthase [Desulfurococcales archaeon]